MARIISARDYGYRKVIRVCLNPDEPEWVHTKADGSFVPHTDVDALPQLPTRGLACFEWCRKCQSNWRVEEILLDGRLVALGPTETLAYVKDVMAARARPTATTIPGVEGVSL